MPRRVANGETARILEKLTTAERGSTGLGYRDLLRTISAI